MIADDEARLVSYLERHAEGNPFFAVELLRALEEEGLLRPGKDRSTLGELARVVVPALLRQVIEGRVARIGEETRRPLEIAAVIGQEVPLALWAELAECDDEALLAVVERLIAANLVEAMRNGTHVRFFHALTRETIYEGVLPPRRRLWHRRVGDLLAAETNADPDAVAYHFEQGGDARAWEWLKEAGERAQRAYAWLTAIDRFLRAASLLEGLPGSEAERAKLLFRSARLHRFSDPFVAIKILETVNDLARGVGDPVLVAHSRVHRGLVECYADHFRSGLQELSAGVAELVALPLELTRQYTTALSWLADSLPATTQIDTTGDDLAMASLKAAGLHDRSTGLAWYAASAGRPREAQIVGVRINRALADVPGSRGGIRWATGFAYLGLGIARAALGRPTEARNAFGECRRILGELDHHAVIAISFLDELQDVALTYGAATPAERRRLAAEAEASLGRAGGALRPGLSPRLAWLGCLVLDGQWAEADLILRDLPAPGNCYLRRAVTAAVALLARHRGEQDRAWSQIRPLLPDGPATEPGDIIHQEGLFLLRLAADLCLDAGDLLSARAWLEAHDRWLAWSGSVLGQADGALGWARWHHAAGDPESASEQAENALAAEPAQPLVTLGAHRLLGELAMREHRFDTAHTQLATALDLAAACEAPFERALTLLVLAELAAEMGSPEEAAARLDEIRRICTPLGAAPILVRAASLETRLARRAEVVGSPAGLTAREMEVLRLLARHKTDKEIAELLYMSPHTASTHVKHILSKLGVASRRDAAEYAARCDLV